MHREEKWEYCSVCNTQGINRIKHRIGRAKFIRLCLTCWETVSLGTLDSLVPDRRKPMHVDSWKCDICGRYVQHEYPDNWRNIFMSGPTEDSEPVEIDLCDECLATKSLKDIPWPKAGEKTDDIKGSGESCDSNSEVCVQR